MSKKERPETDSNQREQPMLNMPQEQPSDDDPPKEPETLFCAERGTDETCYAESACKEQKRWPDLMFREQHEETHERRVPHRNDRGAS